MTAIIQVDQLYKSYGSHEVIKGVSFQIQKGEVFALLGTNGAGKTTILECLEGLRSFEKGTIHIQGTIGVQLQTSSLPEHLKVEEAMKLFSKWNHKQVDSTWINRLGIKNILKKEYHELSTGQKRRLHLAMALIPNPDILILDEPTAGLDVEGRYALHQELHALKQQGKTLLLASHDMAEVEELCDHIAILKNGSLAFCGTPAQIHDQVQNQCKVRMKISGKHMDQPLQYGKWLTPQQGYAYVETSSLELCLQEIMNVLIKQNLRLLDLQVEQTSLEQRFMEIAKES